ncbi:MAG: DUF3943 domain-containing protein [Psychromonas sp.]|nr:DUF3943 domain-containing protein [Psychromonas sp.]
MKIYTHAFIKNILCFILLSVTINAQAKEPSKKENKTIKEVPYRIKPTNSVWEDKDIDPSFYKNPYKISLFHAPNGEDSTRLLNQTYTVIGLGFGVAAALYAMPESVTKWDKDDARNVFDKWIDNVTEGPVWDRDDMFLNYIGHPYFGGVFYMAARKSGYRQWDSFLYSTMMSTFYWEYGIEAFAEVPSVQDLVVTPVFGWVYGEWTLKTEKDIWLNDAKVMNSKILGNISLFLLDPIDSIGRNINYLFGTDILKAGTGYFTLQENKLPNSQKTDTKIGFKVSYTYGSDGSKASSDITKDRLKDHSLNINAIDPVNTSIIGASIGTVWFNFDKDLELKSSLGYQYSLGLYFSRSFSSRLSYARANAKSSTNKGPVAYEDYGLDSQYYLNANGNLRPFLTAGFGDLMINKDSDGRRFVVNGGLGLHYKINNKFAAQTDWRHYYTKNTYQNDDQYSVRVIYRFGNGEGSL